MVYGRVNQRLTNFSSDKVLLWFTWIKARGEVNFWRQKTLLQFFICYCILCVWKKFVFFLLFFFPLFQVNSVRLLFIFKYLYYKDVWLKGKHSTNKYKNADWKCFQDAQDSNGSYRYQCSTMCGIIEKILFCHVTIAASKCPGTIIIQRNLSHRVSLIGRIISMLHLITLTSFILRSFTYINANMTRIICYNVCFLSPTLSC